jgi:hypothetical protein
MWQRREREGQNETVRELKEMKERKRMAVNI